MIGSKVMQHTVSSSAVCSGVGVHSGERVSITLRPAPSGAGIVFVRTDVTDRDNRIPVSAEAVVRTQLNTEVGNAAGVTVSTIEHLMAAFSALRVDNVIVDIDGPEIPIMDGSALPFVQLIDRAGRRRQDAIRAHIEILEPIEVVDGDKRASLLPAEGFEVDFEIDFPSPAIGRQSLRLEIDERSFRSDLASARTFGFIQEVEALRRMGLARGGSLDNVVVIEGDRVLNPEGLRMEREFVRHKVLDAVGDLYVLGAPVIGRLEARYSGHALNNVLARTLMERPHAWRMVSGETASSHGFGRVRPVFGTAAQRSGSREAGGADDRYELRAGYR